MRKSINHLFSIIALATILALVACGDDDGGTGSSFDFIDQNLQGTIDGQSYNYGEGFVDETTINDLNRLSFSLYDISEDFTDVCDFNGFGNEVNVFFNTPAEVGLYELSLDLQNFEGQTVTLFNPDNTLNIIASTGAVEILTITSTQVTGRIDARVDGDNTINGNFTAVFCTTN